MATTSPPTQALEATLARRAEPGLAVDEERPEPRRAPPEPIIVRNETASRLCIRAAREPGGSGSRDQLVLAPFEALSLTPEMWNAWQPPLQGLNARRMIEILRPARRSVCDRARRAAVLILIWATIGLLVAGVALGSRTAWLAIAIASGLLVVAAVLMQIRDRFQFTFLAALAASLVISAAMPACALYYGAGVDELIAALHDGAAGPDTLEIVGRIAQWSVIGIASFLPAGLYFLFDRVKLATLRDAFERDILRFDPTVQTVSDVRARYGALMNEAFTSDRALDRGGRALEPDLERSARVPRPPAEERESHRHGRAFYRQVPVLLATVVIALGWTLTLLNPDSPNLQRGAGDDYVLGLLQPHASPIVFAFLGAYTFTLLSLFRSYVRSDLRPKSYTHAAVRIVVAMIFAWVMAVLFMQPATDLTTAENGGLLVFAFVIGFVPETLLVRLQEVARAVARGRGPTSWLYERHPLTRLVGIDIYDRARLLEEGVGNIEGLAHHNLPELMLQTRIPVGRIVHWADQAILYLHVVAPDDEGAQDAVVLPGGESRLRTLQGYGINTATDLIRARAELERAGAGGEFLSLLDEVDGDGPRRPPRLQVIMAAMEDEQWIPYLQAWHDPQHANPGAVNVDWYGRPRRARAR